MTQPVRDTSPNSTPSQMAQEHNMHSQVRMANMQAVSRRAMGLLRELESMPTDEALDAAEAREKAMAKALEERRIAIDQDPLNPRSFMKNTCLDPDIQAGILPADQAIIKLTPETHARLVAWVETEELSTLYRAHLAKVKQATADREAIDDAARQFVVARLNTLQPRDSRHVEEKWLQAHDAVDSIVAELSETRGKLTIANRQLGQEREKVLKLQGDISKNNEDHSREMQGATERHQAMEQALNDDIVALQARIAMLEAQKSSGEEKFTPSQADLSKADNDVKTEEISLDQQHTSLEKLE